MNLYSLVQAIPKPSVVLITGRRGSGKDVTACALAEELHSQTGKEVYSNYDPEKYKIPKHWHKRKANEYVPDTVQMVSDAHLEYFSREWQKDVSSALVKVVSVSRHRNIDFIYTTQQTSLLDRQAVANVDVLIFKEPSLLAARFERSEVSELTEEATAYFGGTQTDAPYFERKGQKWKWEHALVYTATAKHEIDGIQKPSWFTEELSKVFAEQPVEDAEDDSWTTILGDLF